MSIAAPTDRSYLQGGQNVRFGSDSVEGYLEAGYEIREERWGGQRGFYVRELSSGKRVSDSPESFLKPVRQEAGDPVVKRGPSPQSSPTVIIKRPAPGVSGKAQDVRVAAYRGATRPQEGLQATTNEQFAESLLKRMGKGDVVVTRGPGDTFAYAQRADVESGKTRIISYNLPQAKQQQQRGQTPERKYYFGSSEKGLVPKAGASAGVVSSRDLSAAQKQEILNQRLDPYRIVPSARSEEPQSRNFGQPGFLKTFQGEIRREAVGYVKSLAVGTGKLLYGPNIGGSEKKPLLARWFPKYDETFRVTGPKYADKDVLTAAGTYATLGLTSTRVGGIVARTTFRAASAFNFGKFLRTGKSSDLSKAVIYATPEIGGRLFRKIKLDFGRFAAESEAASAPYVYSSPPGTITLRGRGTSTMREVGGIVDFPEGSVYARGRFGLVVGEPLPSEKGRGFWGDFYFASNPRTASVLGVKDQAKRRISRGEQRKRSLNQAYRRDVFADFQSQEVGIRLRNRDLKNVGVRERVIRADAGGVSQITDVGRSARGGREALTTRGERSFIQEGTPGRKQRRAGSQALADRRQAARGLEEFLSGRGDLQGILIVKQTPKISLFVDKRTPLPDRSSDTGRLLQITDNRAKGLPKQQKASLFVDKRQGSALNRGGFRPGITRRLAESRQRGATGAEALREIFGGQRPTRFVLVDREEYSSSPPEVVLGRGLTGKLGRSDRPGTLTESFLGVGVASRRREGVASAPKVEFLERPKLISAPMVSSASRTVAFQDFGVRQTAFPSVSSIIRTEAQQAQSPAYDVRSDTAQAQALQTEQVAKFVPVSFSDIARNNQRILSQNVFKPRIPTAPNRGPGKRRPTFPGDPGRPPRGIRLPEFGKKERGKLRDSFRVIIRRYGQERVIATNLPRGKALRALAKQLRGTLAAGGRIQKTGTKTREKDIMFNLGSDLRNYRISGGRRIYDQNILIEKRRARLNVAGEVSEINEALRKSFGSFRKRGKRRRFGL